MSGWNLKEVNQDEAWVCVDGHGDERIFSSKPYRHFLNLNLEVMWGQRWTTGSDDPEYRYGVLLPKGTIKGLLGIQMTYKDEPIELVSEISYSEYEV